MNSCRNGTLPKALARLNKRGRVKVELAHVVPHRSTKRPMATAYKVTPLSGWQWRPGSLLDGEDPKAPREHSDSVMIERWARTALIPEGQATP